MDRFARFAWLTLACNVAVVLWGAVVRATGSGAGCGSHWPLCNGEVVPRSPRIETVIELSHRLTSGIALILVAVLLVLAFRLRPRGHAARKAAVTSMALMLGEAAVGAGLVLFELVADNQSMARAMFMGAHLLNTFFLLGFLTLTAHFASGGAPFPLRRRGSSGWGFAFGTVALLVAGVSGAVAALGDTLFPAMTLGEALEQDLSPTGHFLIRLRILHPMISVTAGLWVALLALRSLRGPAGRESIRWARWTLAAVAVQLAAGALNVLLLAPVWMQVVHLLLADLLWIGFILLAAAALAGTPILTTQDTEIPAPRPTG